MNIFFWIVIFCWFIAIFRLLVSSVSSDLLILKQTFDSKQPKKRSNWPTISVIVPAYNEELTLTRTLESVLSLDYPISKMEIIVANDGSSDKTKQIAQEFKKSHKTGPKIRLINRPHAGKARVLNYVIRYSARGSLIVCLDADTTLNIDALRNAAKYFKDRNVVALACYADIIEDGSLIGLAQRVEYIIGYRIKSAASHLGVNYVIPGTGSVFRRSILKRVKYYESNTMTEDLDLTLKILSSKRKAERIEYARDVVAYTEAVHDLKGLLRQRFRWTYGRAQVFVKRSNLFFSSKPEHDKRLTWGMLPYTLIQDLSFLLSPIVNAYFIYYAITYKDASLLIGGIVITIVYLNISIWSVEHLSWKQKARLSIYTPPMYVLIYLTALAEYYALVKAIIGVDKIKSGLRGPHVTWSSPERAKAT